MAAFVLETQTAYTIGRCFRLIGNKGARRRQRPSFGSSGRSARSPSALFKGRWYQEAGRADRVAVKDDHHQVIAPRPMRGRHHAGSGAQLLCKAMHAGLVQSFGQVGGDICQLLARFLLPLLTFQPHVIAFRPIF
jgi:hypothetical protein